MLCFVGGFQQKVTIFPFAICRDLEWKRFKIHVDFAVFVLNQQ